MEKEKSAPNPKEQSNKKTLEKETDQLPVQVDAHSDPVTNFIKNLKRQWEKAKGSGLWKLLCNKISTPIGQDKQAESIIGLTRTVISRVEHEYPAKGITPKENPPKQTKTLDIRKDLEAKPAKQNKKALRP